MSLFRAQTSLTLRKHTSVVLNMLCVREAQPWFWFHTDGIFTGWTIDSPARWASKPCSAPVCPQHLPNHLILAIIAQRLRGNTLHQGFQRSSAAAGHTYATLTWVKEEWNGEGQQSLRRSSTCHPTTLSFAHLFVTVFNLFICLNYSVRIKAASQMQ